MSTAKIFLTPKLEGHRFDDHTLPVSMLEDFSAFEELVFELAKKIYLEKNPSRKRVPKGFTENVYLKLSSIEEGSTIPKILIAAITSLTTPTIPIQNTENFSYFELAREKVFELVENVNAGKSIEIETKFLNYFNRIGKNLEEGETIDFLNEPSSSRNIKFNKNTRRKILLSRNENLEYSEKIKENILIPSIDKKNQIFKIEINGNIIECPFTKDFQDTILTAFQEYENKTLVSIKATGVFNENNKLIHIEDIESMDILDPFDISVRLSELSNLEDKWYDGIDGKALNIEKLELFKNYFENYYNNDLTLPAIFPTINGDIVLEWKKDNNEISLEVNLSNFNSTLFYFEMENDGNDFEEQLDLNVEQNWVSLNSLITKYIG
ncbi:hypothetical protein ACNQGB_04105 [Flavobacterium sp. XS1P32]|uniref:hypothetical protein n=1 Tax=Flavobacterium sp. XS1P32 TaxID=3401726 RepID=UPI003AAE1EB9